ncbi:hypothetical protein HNR02_006538 [Amycolatopsis endophytica]|uniref:Uncharacterized protein n=1 Tax=Amycolatopsis endophytica TaxID=860233 RepID=A0A853BCR3_9PSEU|nr:hypothetical protein [Amycolatopsis endophytica]
MGAFLVDLGLTVLLVLATVISVAVLLTCRPPRNPHH